MDAWLETAGIITITAGGIYIGKKLSHLQGPCWILGCLLSFILVAILIATRCHNAISFAQPFCWLTAGRTRFITLTVAVTVGLTACAAHLPNRYERFITVAFMFGIAVWFAILPFLLPAVTKQHLYAIETKINLQGVCLQSTSYTCGPAAAVTALNNLGLTASEGQIALLSHSCPIMGTLPACLSSALEKLYSDKGLRCHYRHFDSVEELRHKGLTLAILKDTFLSDHCVVVLDVSDDMVIIADPLTGRQSIPQEEFRKIWRFSGIVLNRNSANNT